MRYLFGVLAAVLLLFAGVQYNDPDFYFWGPVYLAPALWAGLAAGRPALLLRPLAVRGLFLCLAAAVVGTVAYWPDDPAWWRRDVWWESEGAREGMGMMIVTAAFLILAASAVVRLRRERSHEAPAEKDAV